MQRRTGEPATELETVALDVVDLAKIVAEVGLDALFDALIVRLRDAIREFDPSAVSDLTRAGFSYTHPELGLVEWMPAMRNGSTISVKTVGYHPSNPTARNLPSVLATTALYDTTSGHLHTICESTFLTALRTGVASALVTEIAAVDGPIRLGVIGAGAQAVTQIDAIGRVRDISELVVADIDPAVAESLSTRLPRFADRIQVVPLEDFDGLVGSFDVLCTCTSVEPGEGPVVRLADSVDHLHVNAVGADFPGKTELPVDFLRSAVVIPDVVEQCLAEGEAQALAVDELGPDMTAVVKGEGGDLVNRRTVFDSTGWSFQDLVAAELFAEHAANLGLGRRLRMFHTPIDPYDPYEAVRF